MSVHDAPRPESEHPLFRVLVLMGGSLTLNCGGAVTLDSGGGAAQGGAAQGGAAQGGAAQGGAAQGGAAQGGAAQGGATQGGATQGGAANCPPAQWDCSGLAQMCEYQLNGLARPAGCVCDLKRPRSVADCSADENLVCLGGSVYPADPIGWDGLRHVQCACAPGGPLSSPGDVCESACLTTYPALSSGPNHVSCQVHAQTCDSAGNCTATAADVLRQDGIVCGCASVILK